MDDERRVRRSGIALVDAETLTAAADAMREIDARSIGKVVEAKARKKQRMAKMIEKARREARGARLTRDARGARDADGAGPRCGAASLTPCVPVRPACLRACVPALRCALCVRR